MTAKVSGPSTRADASQPPDDAITVAAAGVLAATLAAVCHETVGHGIGCVAAGGQVELLTSIWFRCHGATSLTDAGGAIAGVIFGALALSLPLHRLGDAAARLTLLMFGAISLLWVAAQLVVHPVFDRDDWHFIALRMHWPWAWRPLLAVFGALFYAAIVRWIVSLLANSAVPVQAIRLAYVAGAASAALAGLMWSPQPVRSAVEGVLTLGVAPLGLLLAVWRVKSRLKHPGRAVIARSWYFVSISLTVFTAFAVLQGRGIGPLTTLP